VTDPTVATLDITDPRLDKNLIAENRAQAAGWIRERVPFRFRAATVEIPELRAWVSGLVDLAYDGGPIGQIITGPSLLLTGPVGTGKTHNSIGVIRALAESGAYCPWIAITAADVYGLLRPNSQVNSEAELNKLARVPLLVLDDLGVGKPSEWTEDVNYRIINQRYEWERPTLFASNVPPVHLGLALGERVASRLTEMVTTVVVDGPDRRRAKQ
jgi:DNA replication protein DnaC